ncbi:hypothetical protein ACFE04_021717 [Oxalis oulophora]
MRQRRAEVTDIHDLTTNTIDDIDLLVSQNHVTLENIVGSEDDAPIEKPDDLRSFSKSKKKKKNGSNEDIKFFKEGLELIANAIKESTNVIVESTNSKRLPITMAEVWTLVVELGLEPHRVANAYVYLTQKPEMLMALLGCPIEVRKDVLLQMMDNGN